MERKDRQVPHAQSFAVARVDALRAPSATDLTGSSPSRGVPRSTSWSHGRRTATVPAEADPTERRFERYNKIVRKISAEGGAPTFQKAWAFGRECVLSADFRWCFARLAKPDPILDPNRP